MVCLRCRGALEPSGSDPCRHICTDCNQNYLLVLQLVPVKPIYRPLLLASSEDDVAD